MIVKEFIRLTKAIDGQEVLLAPERIVLCERKENFTKVTYRIHDGPQGFGEALENCCIIQVRETVFEIHSLIYAGL